MNNNINIDNLISACETLSRRICSVEGTHHGSSWMFNQCMRAFESHPAIQSITFSVFINAPVMKNGLATISRDGDLRMEVM